MNSVLIGDKYKIESTPLQYTVFEKTSKQQVLMEKLVEQATTDSESDVAERIDSEGWRPVAYVSSLKSALKWLIEHDIRGIGFSDVQAITARIAELHILIDAADIGMPHAPGSRVTTNPESDGHHEVLPIPVSEPEPEETKGLEAAGEDVCHVCGVAYDNWNEHIFTDVHTAVTGPKPAPELLNQPEVGDMVVLPSSEEEEKLKEAWNPPS